MDQGENKENEDMGSNGFTQENIASTKEGRPDQISKSKYGAKGGSKDRRAGSVVEANGPRGKNRQHKPTRGLVFGSAREEIEISVLDKRLRVEKDGVGLPGGVFVRGEEGSKEKGLEVHCRGEGSEKDCSVSGEDLAQKDIVRQLAPRVEGMELGVE